MLKRDEWRRRECGKAGSLEVDHVTPLHKGGGPSPNGHTSGGQPPHRRAVSEPGKAEKRAMARSAPARLRQRARAALMAAARMTNGGAVAAPGTDANEVGLWRGRVVDREGTPAGGESRRRGLRQAAGVQQPGP